MTQRATLLWGLSFLLLMAGAVFLLSVAPALAQADGAAGNFSCVGTTAVGSLYISGATCPTVMRFDNVFSFLACNMEQLSANLMGHMFCGMVFFLSPVVAQMLVLATVIFGAAFTIGVIPATAREFQVFLLKVAFVWGFATNSDYLIDIGYRFFIGGVLDGVAISLSNVVGDTPDTPAGMYDRLDGFIATIIRYATDYVGITKAPTSEDPAADCKNALFAAMAVMAIAFPPAFFLAIGLIIKLVMTFVRAVFGYVYALVGITFLFTLSPFFVSFYLFKVTRPFFDKWLGYLASFALQIIILFAFLAFVMSINYKATAESFASIVISVKEKKEGNAIRMPWNYCTLCDFDVYETDAQGQPKGEPMEDINYGTFLKKPYLKCKMQPSAADASVMEPIALKMDNAFAPAKTDPNATTPPKDRKKFGALLNFVGIGLMQLVVLAYIVEGMLGYVASLAQTLGMGLGAYSAPRLGGGEGSAGRMSVDAPGGGMLKDFERGFKSGSESSSSSNSIGQATDGFRRGLEVMTTGGNDPEKKAGMKNRFVDWLVDPNNLNKG